MLDQKRTPAEKRRSAAANLGRNRALLYREELGTVEKFRPYAPPGRGWIEHIH